MPDPALLKPLRWYSRLMMAVIIVVSVLWKEHVISGVLLWTIVTAAVVINLLLRQYVTRNFPVATVTWESLAGLARVARRYGWRLWVYALLPAGGMAASIAGWREEPSVTAAMGIVCFGFGTALFVWAIVVGLVVKPTE